MCVGARVMQHIASHRRTLNVKSQWPLQCETQDYNRAGDPQQLCSPSVLPQGSVPQGFCLCLAFAIGPTYLLPCPFFQGILQFWFSLPPLVFGPTPASSLLLHLRDPDSVLSAFWLNLSSWFNDAISLTRVLHSVLLIASWLGLAYCFLARSCLLLVCWSMSLRPCGSWRHWPLRIVLLATSRSTWHLIVTAGSTLPASFVLSK